MKKINKANRRKKTVLKNPVAKFSHQFNKAQVFKDKSKYQRKTKHKGQEPFPMLLATVLEKALSLSSVSLLTEQQQKAESQLSVVSVLLLYWPKRSIMLSA